MPILSSSRSLIAGLLVSLLFLNNRTEAGSTTWNGSASTDWNNAGNWAGGIPISSADATFGSVATTNYTADIGAVGGAVKYITFASGVNAGAFTITGIGTLTIGNSSGVINNSAFQQTLNVATITLTNAAPTFDAGSAAGGSLYFGGTTLNLLGGSTLTVTGTNDTTIVNAISGTGSAISKTGTGTLSLQGANGYTGATTVSAGILNIRNATALGTTAAGTTVSSGATLQLQGGISVGGEALSITGTGASGQTGALVNVGGTNNFDGLLTLAGATTLSSDSGTLNLTNAGTITGATFGLTLAGAGNGSISGSIGTTSGGLTKNGAGTWTLSGANSYTGATAINAGILSIQNGAALGTSANTSNTTVASGASLQLSNGVTTQNGGMLVLNGTGTGVGSGALQSVGATGTQWQSNVTIASNATIYSATAGTNGQGLVIGNWSATNTFAIGSNTVTFDGPGNIWINSNVGAPGDTGGVIKNGTGRLLYYGYVSAYTGATVVNAGAMDLLVGPLSGGLYGINGSLTIGTGLGAAGTVSVNTWNNSPNNQISPTSDVTINSDGALNLGIPPIGPGTPNVNGSTGVGTLTLNGGQVNIYSVEYLTPTGGITSNANSAHQTSLISGGTLNLGAPTVFTVARDATLSSDLTVTSVMAGAGASLVKQGAGIMTLTGTAPNTFTGATTVSGGTLAVNASGALGSTSKVTINSGGTVLVGAVNAISNAAEIALAGGALNTGGLSATVGQMTLSANSTLDMGAGTSHLTFNGNSSLGSSTLTVLNWTGVQNQTGGTDQLIFTNSGLTAGSTTSQVQFNLGGTLYNSIFLSAGVNTLELVPVPEPSTIFGAGALVLAIGWRERRRLGALLQKLPVRTALTHPLHRD